MTFFCMCYLILLFYVFLIYSERDPNEPPRFVDVIAAADKTCREETLTLLKTYDEANPDRRKSGGESKGDESAKSTSSDAPGKKTTAAARAKAAAATTTGESKSTDSKSPAKTKAPSKREKAAAAEAQPIELPPAIQQHW
jgi:hypothetical protein